MATTKFHWDMGERIAQRRKAAGLTQEQLAERIDVSTQTISYIETWRNAIRPETLAKLCEALDKRPLSQNPPQKDFADP